MLPDELAARAVESKDVAVEVLEVDARPDDDRRRRSKARERARGLQVVAPEDTQTRNVRGIELLTATRVPWRSAFGSGQSARAPCDVEPLPQETANPATAAARAAVAGLATGLRIAAGGASSLPLLDDELAEHALFGVLTDGALVGVAALLREHDLSVALLPGWISGVALLIPESTTKLCASLPTFLTLKTTVPGAAMLVFESVKWNSFAETLIVVVATDFFGVAEAAKRRGDDDSDGDERHHRHECNANARHLFSFFVRRGLPDALGGGLVESLSNFACNLQTITTTR